MSSHAVNIMKNVSDFCSSLLAEYIDNAFLSYNQYEGEEEETPIEDRSTKEATATDLGMPKASTHTANGTAADVTEATDLGMHKASTHAANGTAADVTEATDLGMHKASTHAANVVTRGETIAATDVRIPKASAHLAEATDMGMHKASDHATKRTKGEVAEATDMGMHKASVSPYAPSKIVRTPPANKVTWTTPIVNVAYTSTNKPGDGTTNDADTNIIKQGVQKKRVDATDNKSSDEPLEEAVPKKRGRPPKRRVDAVDNKSSDEPLKEAVQIDMEE